ncbi:hypothetical protein NAC44_16905 [Allorhizobium sp. BGMRC 0089]|uniref:hypothetical protein n=1 Tax=Allorhizobium sonneratiae TaxID=2934936 RepID=UPI0020346981|nr:hypothetical protein [Allorhizobium sonneratiae]MCM2294007.1 hypothetical protein [Allorhizobium sonneratiae]
MVAKAVSFQNDMLHNDTKRVNFPVTDLDIFRRALKQHAATLEARETHAPTTGPIHHDFLFKD